jgi:hypothetical protein
MEKLVIEGTATTPSINFDPLSGRMIIAGRAIPDQCKEFWSPVLSWFYAYAARPEKITSIIIDMEYFNDASAKQLMFLFAKINEIFKHNYSISVLWFYDTEDCEMKEAGLDFSSLLAFDIELKERSENLAIAG